MHAVTQFKQFVKFFTHHQHRTTRVAQRHECRANLGRSANIDPPSRLRHDQQTRGCIDFTSDNKFLQITTRQRLCRRLRTACFDLVFGDDGTGLCSQCRHVDPTQTADRLTAREQQVMRQTQGGHCAATEAFIGHKMQTQCTSLRGIALAHRLSRQTNTVRRGPHILTAQCVQQLALAIARYTRDTHDFPLVDL